MTKEEFSRLPSETQFKIINEYAKEVFKEGEECANAFEYGRPCETEPTTFEGYLSGVSYLQNVKDGWLQSIDKIVARQSYDVELDLDYGWKHIKELDEQEAIQYIRKKLISITNMPDAGVPKPTGLITTGFEFIYKDGTNKFFEL